MEEELYNIMCKLDRYGKHLGCAKGEESHWNDLAFSFYEDTCLKYDRDLGKGNNKLETLEEDLFEFLRDMNHKVIDFILFI